MGDETQESKMKILLTILSSQQYGVAKANVSHLISDH